MSDVGAGFEATLDPATRRAIFDLRRRVVALEAAVATGLAARDAMIDDLRTELAVQHLNHPDVP